MNRLIALAEETGVRLMAGQPMRFGQALIKARELKGNLVIRGDCSSPFGYGLGKPDQENNQNHFLACRKIIEPCAQS